MTSYPDEPVYCPWCDGMSADQREYFIMATEGLEALGEVAMTDSKYLSAGVFVELAEIDGEFYCERCGYRETVF